MNPIDQIPDSQDIQAQIDAYLMDALTPAAQRAFEEQIAQSAALRERVESQKTLLRAVEAHGLKATLDEYHKEMDEARPKKWMRPGWLAMAASFLILLGVCTWAIFGTLNSPDKIFKSHFKPDPGLPTIMGTTSEYEFYYGMVNYKRKEYKEAIQRWETLYAANPENDTLNYFLGVANLASGNARQAEKYLQRAKENRESAFLEEARYYLALALVKENKINQAKEVLSKSTSPTNKVLLDEIESL